MPNLAETAAFSHLSAKRQALDRLNRLLDHPRGTRMPSVYGDSGMSKTMIMKRFRDQHPPTVPSIPSEARWKGGR
ncbi:TniB family NTP-binding protein (plasmid) [Sinorhizobium meliloti]|nr:TniB family NTP-binding protein [Sinorhizobium meliloti]WKL24482.1 TniB family NTP-binding protein [Sinorhizobium meliloti]